MLVSGLTRQIVLNRFPINIGKFNGIEKSVLFFFFNLGRLCLKVGKLFLHKGIFFEVLTRLFEVNIVLFFVIFGSTKDTELGKFFKGNIPAAVLVNFFKFFFGVFNSYAPVFQQRNRFLESLERDIVPTLRVNLSKNDLVLEILSNIKKQNSELLLLDILLADIVFSILKMHLGCLEGPKKHLFGLINDFHDWAHVKEPFVNLGEREVAVSVGVEAVEKFLTMFSISAIKFDG